MILSRRFSFLTQKNLLATEITPTKSILSRLSLPLDEWKFHFDFHSKRWILGTACSGTWRVWIVQGNEILHQLNVPNKVKESATHLQIAALYDGSVLRISLPLSPSMLLINFRGEAPELIPQPETLLHSIADSEYTAFPEGVKEKLQREELSILHSYRNIIFAGKIGQPGVTKISVTGAKDFAVSTLNDSTFLHAKDNWLILRTRTMEEMVMEFIDLSGRHETAVAEDTIGRKHCVVDPSDAICYLAHQPAVRNESFLISAFDMKTGDNVRRWVGKLPSTRRDTDARTNTKNIPDRFVMVDSDAILVIMRNGERICLISTSSVSSYADCVKTWPLENMERSFQFEKEIINRDTAHTGIIIEREKCSCM